MQTESFYIDAMNKHYSGTGWSWGSFEYALLNLLEKSDLHNLDKLSTIYPDFVSAFVAVQRVVNVPEDTPVSMKY